MGTKLERSNGKRELELMSSAFHRNSIREEKGVFNRNRLEILPQSLRLKELSGV